MNGKKDSISRRDFLTGTAAGLVLTGSNSAFGSDKIPAKRPNRAIRFAHFTDIHLEPGRNAPQGLTAALRHTQALDDKPELLITGGDNIMDCLGADNNWATTQFNLLKEIFAKECKLPVKHCIGNHDVWGWDKEKSKITEQEPLWGKNRPVKEYDLPGRYYSFDKKPWHFIILDSTHPDKSVYTARLDAEQFDWLQKELETNKDSHVCIISHIPILSVATFLDGDNEKNGRWTLPDEWMHLDARKIKDLFRKYPNVRLCISGHMHMVDRVVYNDVTYICDGAVCGAWWNGNQFEFEEGYGVFDLYDDGTFEHRYIPFGWNVPEKPKT